MLYAVDRHACTEYSHDERDAHYRPRLKRFLLPIGDWSFGFITQLRIQPYWVSLSGEFHDVVFKIIISCERK